MMRNCPNCGVKVFDDEAKFCIECGFSLAANSIKSTNTISLSKKTSNDNNQSISVKRGQKADLTKNNPNLKNIIVKLSWQCSDNFDLDAASFLLANNGKVKDETDFVYYNNTKHSSDSVEHKSLDNNSEHLKIDISKIPTEVTRIAFTLTINDAENLKQNFSQIKNITLQVISENSNEELLKYTLDDDLSIETAIVVAEIYRYKENWKFNAIGAGFQGGLAALCNNFGIDVNEETNSTEDDKIVEVENKEDEGNKLLKLGIEAEEAKDYKTAFIYYEKSVKYNNYEAMAQMGHLYEYGKGVEKNYNKALALYKKSIEGNNANAMIGIGNIYNEGKGVEKNHNKAIEWFIKADEAGHDMSFRLGLEYFNNGNLNESFKWYAKGANRGDKVCMNILGHFYHNGNGVKKDSKKAFYWYKKAADLGVIDAMLSLGYAYRNGEGVEKDLKKSFEYFKKVYDLGNNWGLLNMARAYRFGEGVEKDTKTAVNLFMETAKIKDDAGSWAIFALAEMNEKGEGMPKNEELAYIFYSEAANRGNKQAMQKLQEFQ